MDGVTQVAEGSDDMSEFTSGSLANGYFGPDVLGSPKESKRESVVLQKGSGKIAPEARPYGNAPKQPLVEDLAPILCWRHDPESLRLTITARDVRCRACDNLVQTQRVQFVLCRHCGLIANRCTSCGQQRTQSSSDENVIAFLNQSIQPDYVAIATIRPMNHRN